MFDVDNFEVGLQYRVASCVISFSQGFQAIKLKLCTDDISILKMCMWLLARKKISSDKITAFST